ncbi:MAG: DUF2442 domain-containing protein [Faecalibacterium sp.]
MSDVICYGKEELIEVQSVVAKEDYTLSLCFSTGERKIYNAQPLLSKPAFQPLNSKIFFLTAKVECGTVVWSDDIDIAPEHLYEESVLLEA